MVLVTLLICGFNIRYVSRMTPKTCNPYSIQGVQGPRLLLNSISLFVLGLTSTVRFQLCPHYLQEMITHPLFVVHRRVVMESRVAPSFGSAEM